jgi:mono/diheme cytochrome c family protein
MPLIHISRRWLFLAVLFTGGISLAESIELWRSANDRDRVRIHPDKLSWVERELPDLQYGKTLKFRGVELSTLLDKVRATEGEDLALLHFVNGMVIPIRLFDGEAQRRMNVFVAFEVSGKEEPFTSEFSRVFPPVAKAGAEKRDRRPIRFEGNKVVVAGGWHPQVAPNAAARFSPWKYVDSLEGIELAQERAYVNGFRAASKEGASGFEVFQGRCQFCHGVRNVGAKYGWDFVEPVPLSQHRSPKSLALHVRYREGDAPERGLMMPAFPELKDQDLQAVWTWVNLLAKQGEP